MNISHKVFLFLLFLTFLNVAEAREEKKLTVSSKKKFLVNEPLKFSVNIGSKEGFVYLIYVDKEGGTNVLYPDNNKAEKKKTGHLKFPKDFGGKEIHTSKDCKDCKEEKTTIFVLLSDDPIEDIQNMSERDIKHIESQQKHKHRNISIDNKKKATILVNKIDFFVE